VTVSSGCAHAFVIQFSRECCIVASYWRDARKETSRTMPYEMKQPPTGRQAPLDEPLAASRPGRFRRFGPPLRASWLRSPPSVPWGPERLIDFALQF
jgi:hypothetical protein